MEIVAEETKAEDTGVGLKRWNRSLELQKWN
jgi:hypothetical protein